MIIRMRYQNIGWINSEQGGTITLEFQHLLNLVVSNEFKIKEEIMEQLEYTKEWGAKFVISMPELQIIEYERALQGTGS